MAKIARVQLPDGRIARFEVADDATPEQVTQAAQRLAAPKEKPKSFWQGVLEGATPYGANAARMIGMANPIGGALNVMQNMTAPKPNIEGLVRGRQPAGIPFSPTAVADAAERSAQETFKRSPYQGSGTGKFVGNVIGSLPAAALPAGPVVQGMAAGAMGAKLDDPASLALNTAAGGVGGYVGGKLARPIARAAGAAGSGVQNVVRKFAGSPRGIVATGPHAMETLAPLGRQAQARAARLESLGVTKPTLGVVTRDPAAFSFEQNMAKLQGVGDDLAQQMRNTEATLVDKGRSMVRELGGAKGPEATGKGIEDVLDAKRAEMQEVTSALYRQVRETQGDVPVGRLQGFRELLNSPDVADDVTLDGFRQSIERRLTRHTEHGGLTTVQQAEDLRKMIGRIGNNAEPSVRWARKMFIDALDDDVVSVLGDDAFKAARASARERFTEFGKTFAGKLADEKLAPELLTRRVLGDGVKLSDLRALRQSLHTGTTEQVARGQEAWRSLQAQAVDDLLGKSVDADGNLIGSTLSREFNKSALKLRELLGPQDFKTMRRLAAATRDVKAYPVGHSVNTSNTATTMANMFANVPPKVRDGWMKMLGKIALRGGAHMAAAPVPGGHLAVEGVAAAGSVISGQRAQQAAAQALTDKIRLAQNPTEAAAALRALQTAAQSSPAARQALEYITKAGTLGGSVGMQQLVPAR